MTCPNCHCKDCRMGRARERRRRMQNARLFGKTCGLRLSDGRVCEGTIGPDILEEPMCYGCGPLDMMPEAELAKLGDVERCRREAMSFNYGVRL